MPEFPKHQWPVTLRQLMGHTAGVANDGGDEGPLFSKRCERPVEALQFLSGHERELLFEPGTKYQLFELRLDRGERGRRSRRG